MALQKKSSKPKPKFKGIAKKKKPKKKSKQIRRPYQKRLGSTQVDKRIDSKFWEFRSKHGRDKLFETPELLWEAACEFFQWHADNPLYEVKGYAHRGKVKKEEFSKIRAMTISGLCFYLGCNQAYFRQFKQNMTEKDKDFSTILDSIEQVIYNQKFQGAAADLLNQSIISRELGLADKSEITGKDGAPLKTGIIHVVSVDKVPEIAESEDE